MKMIGIAAMICLAVILVGCGIAQSGSSQQQEISDAQEIQAVTESSTSVIDDEAGSEQVETTNDDLPDEAASQIAIESEEDKSSARSELAIVPNDLLPQLENELADGEYRWSQLLPRDGIRPIYENEVEFVDAQSASYDDDELVIGVEINGEAKAYAIGPLNSREMVNDTVGGVPILVTW